jgi:hypothetical protein
VGKAAMTLLPLSRHLFTTAFIVGLVFTAATGRAQKLDNKRPSVYITFKEFIEQTKGNYPSQGARLLLHNNTRWPIHFETHYDSAAGRRQIGYVIELADGQRDERANIDVTLGGKLMPGRTLTIVVPRGNFPQSSQIFIEFNFSWELRDGDTVRNETTHRAYFLSSDLPPLAEVILCRGRI